MNNDLVQSVVLEVLSNTPYKPFLCLPLSALLYAQLRDNHNIPAIIKTGNLSYDGVYIFKQDFKISSLQTNAFQSWDGHAWVEIGDIVYDLSFFRTLYSEKFTKPSRENLINAFGLGRGCLIFSKTEGITYGLKYDALDTLTDTQATGIIKGFEQLLNNI